MPQGLPTVVPNQIIESAHINAIADRIVGRFANTAERDAAITVPVNGMVCVTTDTNTFWQRRGGAWYPSIARVGCSLTITSFSIATGAAANLPWSNEVYDTDNFHAPNATAVTIPAGLAGIYLVTVQVDANGTLNGASNVQIAWSGSLPIISFIPAANRYGSVSGAIEVTAGAAFNTSIFNGHSGAVLFSARLNMTRIAP